MNFRKTQTIFNTFLEHFRKNLTIFKHVENFGFFFKVSNKFLVVSGYREVKKLNGGFVWIGYMPEGDREAVGNSVLLHAWAVAMKFYTH